MALRLRFKDGPLAGQVVDVGQGLTLGRSDADVAIEDEEVSSRHAAVRPVEGFLELEDLRSSNGTWVNGHRVEGAVRLRAGDVVTLGRSAIEVVDAAGERAAAADAPAPAPPPQQAFLLPSSGGRRPIATRRLTPTLISIAVIVATAASLVVYFAQR
jgi:predicted component of type VI protein secretion system